ncbi:MAG: methyl-accepting chemotaxis protein [Verrucomicrobiaceae bacterium]|nr:methyl-accepting chemotaxis protein [Verrucomicrobiaceae bacterium]
MLRNLSIKYKLAISPLVALIGFGVFLAFVINTSLNNIQRVDSIRDSAAPLVNLTARNLDLLEQMENLFSVAVATGDKELVDSAAKSEASILANFAAIKVAATSAASVADANAKSTADLDPALREYFKESSQLAQDLIAGNASTDVAKKAKLKQDHFDELKQQLAAQKNFADTHFSEVIENSNNAARRAIYVGTGLGILLVITLLGISIGISVALTHSVKKVSDSLRQIAQGNGDLTVRVHEQGDDEIGELVRWFNLFVEKLHRAVSGVVAVTDPLAQAGKRLHEVAEISAHNSSEQQFSTNALMSAMGELILSVGEIAENAAATASATRDTDKEAKRGTEKVSDAVTSINSLAEDITEAAAVIGRLQKDADNVGVILDVIKNIAEQTNLLALNAAIEAARAGEQGRGFAVVADEVRTLASRTQQSTQEIQQVIQNLREASKAAVAVMTQSQDRARISVDQAAEAGNTLTAISDRVASIDGMSHQIAAATEEQDHVTKSIQQSIGAMSESANAVANSTREVNQLSEQLRDFVARLRDVSAQFRV